LLADTKQLLKMLSVVKNNMIDKKIIATVIQTNMFQLIKLRVQQGILGALSHVR